MPHALEYVRTLAATVDAKGEYFPGHSDAVAYLTTLLGTEAGIQKPMLSQLHIAAMLHDTGKLLIPDSILNAPRKLTDEEWVIMRKHSTWSAQIASAITGIGEIAVWVRHHHEHWDGSGYPDGLTGDRIPWQSRLMLIADAFHVMTAVRPYQNARSRIGALTAIQENAGTQFDPNLVDMLANRPPILITRKDLISNGDDK